MYHLSVYVPATHSEKLKSALFTAGAGRIGNYDSCCWETRGTGQFRPLKGSQPFVGQESLTEFVDELKLEMVCAPEHLKNVVKALKESHPYETPAYFVCPTIDV